jgi:putative peptidoglycan binding protein
MQTRPIVVDECYARELPDYPGGGVRGAVPWHVAASLETLRGQLNALAPNRSKRSDGAIGDAEHASRSSDHNPWYRNTVTARDFTHDPAGGLDCERLAYALTHSGDRRIKYVIWNRRIWEGTWEPYTGANPHDHHLHLSVVASPLCEYTTPWELPGMNTPPPSQRRELRLATPRMTGDDVRQVQRVLRAWYGLPPQFVDGFYGPGTVAIVKRAQAGVPPQPKLVDDGVVGDATYRKLGIL